MMRRGFSLLELIVVLVITAIVIGIVAAASRPPRRTGSDSIANVKAAALRTGRPVVWHEARGGIVITATAYPSGRVIAESTLLCPGAPIGMLLDSARSGIDKCQR